MRAQLTESGSKEVPLTTWRCNRRYAHLSVIVSDIPAVIPENSTIDDAARSKTEEVEIEARVIAATRNFARDIGVQLGFGWGNGNGNAVGGAGSVGASPLTPGHVGPPHRISRSQVYRFRRVPRQPRPLRQSGVLKSWSQQPH